MAEFSEIADKELDSGLNLNYGGSLDSQLHNVRHLLASIAASLLSLNEHASNVVDFLEARNGQE